MITIGYSTRESNPELQEYLKNTCKLQNIQVIEKVNNGEKSLSKIYNEIISESKFDILVLCHDDIEINTKNWGDKILKIFKKNPEYGIIGVAGTTDLVNGKWWEIKESMNGIVTHKHNGKKWTNYYSKDQGNKITDMVVMDGLFLSLDKRKIKTNFDESFDGFHFYDISFCFSNYIKGVKLGLTTQIRVTHFSIGMTNEKWNENKIKFENLYKDHLPIRLTNNKTFNEKLIFNSDSIGVGMVTYNAEHRIKQSSFTVPNWVKNFVIVNDGTPYDVNSYPKNAKVIQHKTNMSVGVAKTTAINYLMELGCEHIFIMEDDILIKDENVFKEYITHSIISGIKHLNFALHGPANKIGSRGFTNLSEREDVDGKPNPRMIIPYTNDNDNKNVSIALYPNCVGAFSYYHRKVIDDIGGFDPIFKNAWEHVEHTYQAIKKGYHPSFWYFADINESWKYLTDIPNAIKESTIAKTPTWTENYNKGTAWYKKKHGITPTETPLHTPQQVHQQLQILFQNR